MDGQDTFGRQRAELESVLSSEAFRRAPNLCRLLNFICQKHWEGKGSEIKEYTLAIEVLGRPADFDPLTDSIVRVELHRLREKLKHYYQDSSQHHDLRIHLRSGTYVPEFLPTRVPGGNGADSQAIVGSVEETPENLQATVAPKESGLPVPLPPATSRKSRSFSIGLLLAAGLSVGGILVLSVWGWKAIRSSRANLVQRLPVASASPAATLTGGQDIRILAGFTKGDSYIDRFGETWASDRYFDGGVPVSFPRQITALATDPALFETARWGRFKYAIPLSPGSYELRLFFMERLIGPGTIERQGGENNRVFDVLLNGKTVLSSFDPYSDAGGNLIAHIRAFKEVSPGSDGYLRIQFIPARDEPFINAIEILPTLEGQIPPIRIVAQENAVRDIQGRLWRSDRYYRGGVPVRRSLAITGNADPDLFGGERYGHFSYVIPVPEGSYGLTLYFAEAYFGSQDNRYGGVGSRVFDLYCNGQALLRDFDVFREAGGAGKALIKTFHGLKPNPQGQLALDFVPVKNYALIDAIEVVDESRN